MARTLIWASRALVVCAALLLSSGSTQARAPGHGGGGHAGGGHVGGVHAGYHGGYGGAYRGGYDGAYRGGYGYRGYGRGYGYYGGYYRYYGLGFGWGYPYYGYGWGYPSNGYSSYGYSYPWYSGISATPPDGAYANDADVAPAGNAEQYASTSNSDALNDNKAHITIRVPDEDAVLTINGQQMSSTGKERYFQSPELTSGEYSYEVQAQCQVNGKQVTETKKVQVRPNTESFVSFMPEDQ